MMMLALFSISHRNQLIRVPVFEELLTLEEDQEIMMSVTDINVEFGSSSQLDYKIIFVCFIVSSFKANFPQTFDVEKNKYFTNKTLTKSITESNGQTVTQGTPINWRPGKVRVVCFLFFLQKQALNTSSIAQEAAPG